MRQHRYSIRITSGVVVIAAIFVLSFGDITASECERCHTQKDKLKAITDTLPGKTTSTEISGQG